MLSVSQKGTECRFIDTYIIRVDIDDDGQNIKVLNRNKELLLLLSTKKKGAVEISGSELLLKCIEME